MSFDWRTDDILRMAPGAEVEHLATEQDGSGCFSLKVRGEVCAVIRFIQNPPWLARFLRHLSEGALPALTVQDWLAVLNIAPATFFATLNVLLQCGFVLRPQRRFVGAQYALA